MADKVSKEESIARVYQFLNKQKDWKEVADKNGDGTVIKTEFRAYLLGSGFKFNNGENKEDLIDVFWKSIDSKTSGKIGGGSALNNKNALDSKEVENIENSIEATKKITVFMQDKEAPAELDAQFRTAWKKSVKEGLIYRASEYLKTASLEDINDEWLNNAFKLSSAKATADYTATATIKSELGNVEGYSVGDDKDLKGIVDEYIAQLDENPKDDTTIINEIKQIVAAYVDTAKTNSKASTDLLAQYGYDPDYNLNDLQIAVLTNEITSKILDYIKTNNPDIYVDEYKAEVEAAVKEYVEKYLSDKSANEFTELKSFDVSTFANSDEYNTLITNIKNAQEAVKTAREQLKSYIIGILNEKDSEKDDIVLQVIGTKDANELDNKLKELKTVAQIEAKHNELKTKITELEDARVAQEAERKAKTIDWNENQKSYAGYIAYYGQDETPSTTTTFAELYEHNGVINLLECEDLLKGTDWKSAVNKAKTGISDFTSSIVSSLSGDSNKNLTALNKAKDKVDKLYKAALEHSIYNWADKKSDRDNKVSFEGEEYSYRVSKFYLNDSAKDTGYSQQSSASNNSLGLRIGEQYDDGWFQIVVNSACVMDLFKKFYQEALNG